MLLMLLCLLLGSSDPLPYEVVIEANDETETPSGEFMTKPSSAVYHNGVLYIADVNANKAFAIEPGKPVRTISSKGSGPQEMRHHPNHIGVNQAGELVIGTWNLWETLYVDPSSGVVLRKEKRGQNDPRYYGFFNLPARAVPYQEQLETGFAYIQNDGACRFGRMPSRDALGRHLSAGFIKKADDGSLVLMKRSGHVEVIGAHCKRLAEMSIPLALMTVEPEPHPLLTSIRKQMSKGSVGKGYVYGHPVLSAAARDKSTVWALVKDEVKWKETQDSPFHTSGKHPGFNSILFLINPIAGKVIYKVEMDGYFNDVRYEKEHLIMVANEDALVRVYHVPLDMH